MIWQVPKIWSGERCFIIGGGSSFARQLNVPEEIITQVHSKKLSPTSYLPYLSILKNEHVIGVNMAFLFGEYLDFVFFGDQNFWKNNKTDLFNSKSPVVTCHDAVKNIRQLKRDTKKRLGISNKSSDMVSWNGNSGAAAINFAYHTGVKQIILLGFDMNLDAGNNQHWHKAYQSRLDKVQGTFKVHMSAFPEIAKDAKTLGIEIINANPESAINSFAKVNLRDVL